MITRERVFSDIVELINEVTQDWELPEEIREDSLILADLGLESIDAVALATAIEEKYQREIPFTQFIADLQEQDRRDFSVGYLVDFVTRQLGASEGAA